MPEVRALSIPEYAKGLDGLIDATAEVLREHPLVSETKRLSASVPSLMATFDDGELALLLGLAIDRLVTAKVSCPECGTQDGHRAECRRQS